MSGKVFISYSSQDQEAAIEVCRILELREIQCWIAPRDVTPGEHYGEAVIRAIEACCGTVLILSEHANGSVHVRNEVERAISKGKTVLPVRIREVEPSKALELFISSSQWLDAWTPPLEQMADRLADAIRSIRKTAGEDATASSAKASSFEFGRNEERKPNRKIETEGTKEEDDLIVDLPGGAKMEMVWIPPGRFLMGSSDSEPGRYGNASERGDEGPQHEVTIMRGFYLGKCVVTQGQWQAVMGTAPWVGKGFVQEEPSHPAVGVSWADIQWFIQKLRELTEESLYRLPTEAEWEYACRAGTTTFWSFGDNEDELRDYAWYRTNASDVDEKYAHRVGMKKANPWGLYDMHGNVCEWVQDRYGPYSSSEQVDPLGPKMTGEYRIARGGCYAHDSRDTRSSVRFVFKPSERLQVFSLRLLRQAE